MMALSLTTELSMAVLTFLAVLAAGPVHGEPPRPEHGVLKLSKPLPIARQPVQIYVAQAPASAKVHFVIRSQATGEVVADGPGVATDQGPGLAFTAAEAGYYLATAQTSGSSLRWTLRFPVVDREYHFAIWPPLQPEEGHLRCLSSRVIVQNAGKDAALVAHWRAQGSTVLGATFTGGRQVDLRQSDQANIDKLVGAWTQGLASTCDGIYIDELGAYPTPEGQHKVRLINAALRRFREENPKALIYAAMAGSPLPEQCAGLREAGAVGLLEAYEPWLTAGFGTHRFYDYIDRRIETARHTDLIQEHGRMNGAVIFIGQDGLHGGTTRPQLEEAVRYIRRQAPEMPGLAFYASGRTIQWLGDTKMREFAETLCERYYVRPVLSVNQIWLEPSTPRASQAASVQVRVHNIGGMKARNVRVQLHASSIATGKRRQVGTVTLDAVDVGQVEVVDRSLPNTNYTWQDVAGAKTPVFSTPGRAPRDRISATFSWKPRDPGAYVLYAAIEAQDDVTLLDAVMERSVVVADGQPQ